MCSESLQAHVRPVLAAVGGLVDSVADRHAVPHPRFACSHPNVLRVGRINRHRADRLHALPVEHRLECGAAVDRLPHASARRADEKRDAAVLVHPAYRRNAAAHRCRPDVARRQSRNGGAGDLRRILRLQQHARAQQGKRSPAQHGRHCPADVMRIVHDFVPLRGLLRQMERFQSV